MYFAGYTVVLMGGKPPGFRDKNGRLKSNVWCVNTKPRMLHLCLHIFMKCKSMQILTEHLKW